MEGGKTSSEVTQHCTPRYLHLLYSFIAHNVQRRRMAVIVMLQNVVGCVLSRDE